MTEKWAFFNDAWVPEQRATLALDDWGILQGAIVVDRLRTCNLKAHDVDQHLIRLRVSCDMIGVTLPKQERLEEIIGQCVERNLSAYSQRDFSIVILVTPGRESNGNRGARPSLIVHSTALNWAALHNWYTHGQSLILSANRNIPPACWSPQLKTRSRMQYYLADRAASLSSLKYAGAVLLSLDNRVTETSAANIIVVDGKGRLVCPPRESVLHGISLQRTVRLAADAGIDVSYQPISIEAAGLASEVLLTGSSGCLWPASRIGDISFQNPSTRPVYSTLRDRWMQDIGLDYVAQAAQAVGT